MAYPITIASPAALHSRHPVSRRSGWPEGGAAARGIMLALALSVPAWGVLAAVILLLG
jgi:hypothetical protein